MQLGSSLHPYDQHSNLFIPSAHETFFRHRERICAGDWHPQKHLDTRVAPTVISTRRFRLDKSALPLARLLTNPDQPEVRPRNIKSGRSRHGDMKNGIGTALNLWYNYRNLPGSYLPGSFAGTTSFALPCQSGITSRPGEQ